MRMFLYRQKDWAIWRELRDPSQLGFISEGLKDPIPAHKFVEWGEHAIAGDGFQCEGHIIHCVQQLSDLPQFKDALIRFEVDID